jgi:serine/threonine protein kinase
MNPEQWKAISKIFHSAIQIEPGQREAFLDQACGDDSTLRREVESLLAASDAAGDFIENSPTAISLPSADSHQHLSCGEVIGHYTIEKIIGTGGMGEVYLASDTRLNRPVAIKRLPATLSINPAFLRRFRTEAQAAAILNHPNIATIYSVEQFDVDPFITMEYVEGKTLGAVTPAGGQDIRTFLNLFVDISAALQHAHEKGITHRDIKPGNIMVSSAGAPKILDFGLAHIAAETHPTEDMGVTQPGQEIGTPAAEDTGVTQPGQVIGTPAYMSPEQAEGSGVDHRSDIFSLGVVMYEALTGKRPFRGSSHAEVVSNVLKLDPPPVANLRAETPFLISRLISRCMAKDKKERFQSMQEVSTILCETKAVIDAGTSTQSSLRRFYREARNASSPVVWAIAVPLLVVVAILAWYLSTRRSADPPINLANITLRKLSESTNVVFAQITPDGRSVAYITIEENDERALWIRRLEDRTALRIVPPQPVQYWGGLALTPDGSQVYYNTSDSNIRQGTLYRISGLGGAPRKLAERVNDLGSLSKDGKRILFVRYEDTMQLFSANAAEGGDEVVLLTGAKNVIFRDPQYSADGNSIFLIKYENIGGKEYWSLVEIPAAGGEPKEILAPRRANLNEIAVPADGKGLVLNAVDETSNLPQIYYVSLADRSVSRMTNDLNSYFGVSASADGNTIVAAQRSNSNDLWVSKLSSPNAIEKVTSDPTIYSSAVLAPDGRIVYDTVENNRPYIAVMDANGKNSQPLTESRTFDYEPKVSPDGKFIVFTSERTGEPRTWRMNIDGNSPVMLGPVEGISWSPEIAPNGTDVLFKWLKNDARIMGRIPLTGGDATAQDLPSDSYWAFSPDGKQIAYAFFDQELNRYKVGLKPADGGNPTMIFDIAPIAFLTWTPDGSGLLYRNRGPGADSNSNIWLQPIAGGKPRLFLDAPATIRRISISKDGEKIAVLTTKLLTDAVVLSKNKVE